MWTKKNTFVFNCEKKNILCENCECASDRVDQVQLLILVQWTVLKRQKQMGNVT